MPTIALIGHVSSGKSSTVGHLVKACGVMDPETLADCERDALELGSSGNKFSWIVDSLQAEREGGTSIEAHEQFIRTGNGGMTLIDTPGCPFYMKAITNSASQADIAVLVVSAGEGEFEAGMAKDGGGTTVSSVMIAHSLGVKNLVIVVNKMEAAGFSEERFTEIKETLAPELKKIGFKPKQCPWIPYSAMTGDNLGPVNSEHMPWYSGPTVLQTLATFDLEEDAGAAEKPLRFPVRIAHRIKKVGTVLVGRVECGTLKVGNPVYLSPGPHADVTVMSIQKNHESVQEAGPGDHVGIVVDSPLKDLAGGLVVSDRGAVNEEEDSDAPRPLPAKAVSTFDAQLVVLSGAGGAGGAIKAGYSAVVDCHTAHVSCTIKKIKTSLDRKTGAVLMEGPASVNAGDACIVTFEPCAPMCVELYSEFPALGRILVRDGASIVATGVVKQLVTIEEAGKTSTRK